MTKFLGCILFENTEEAHNIHWVTISLFLNQMKFCWHLISSLCIHWYSSWKFTTKLISQRIFLHLQYSDTMSFRYSNCKLLFMTSSFCDLLGINWFSKTSFYNKVLSLAVITSQEIVFMTMLPLQTFRKFFACQKKAGLQHTIITGFVI